LDRNLVLLPAFGTKRGRGGVLNLQDGTKKRDKLLVTHSNMHPTNQQVG
jgi:hypothetical protein